MVNRHLKEEVTGHELECQFIAAIPIVSSKKKTLIKGLAKNYSYLFVGGDSIC